MTIKLVLKTLMFYAENLKMYTPIWTSTDEFDLQEGLKRVYRSFNIIKCFVMTRAWNFMHIVLKNMPIKHF